MQERKQIFNLAKLMIAAAWADGELSNDEINALKDLLFMIPDITMDEWKKLELYMASPVGQEEADMLLEKVLNDISTEDDKKLIIDSLTKLVNADGILSDEEAEFLEQVKIAVDEKKTGLFSQLGNLLGGSVIKRMGNVKDREEMLDDFIHNTVYFKLVKELEARGKQIKLSEEQIRVMSLAAALMARTAWADDKISSSEKEEIKNILMVNWSLQENEADLVTEISCASVTTGIDYYRLTRTFYDSAGFDDRKLLIYSLFRIAASAGDISAKEIEDIRAVANAFKLDHKDFIDAKLAVIGSSE